MLNEPFRSMGWVSYSAFQGIDPSTLARAHLRTGDKEYHMTFYAVLSKEGVATGFYHAEATLILSDSGDELTGESKTEFLDLNWKAVGGREGNITAKRLKAPEKPPGV